MKASCATTLVGFFCLGIFCSPLPAPVSAADHPVGGARAPATTPALPPEEARNQFTVPDGFEVRLFASEPDVVNPVAMTWDERGRLWVVELYEYPLGAKPGEKPRDKVKILEDTNRDGRADKVTVFADGLNLATGILLSQGGAYVGQAPHLLFLKDTDGDDVADKREVVLTGFGLEDRHELLNGFTWGPDGHLYMTHGVFTHSKVTEPGHGEGDGVIMNAAVARFNPRNRNFEVFADGTSNPWGVDFDRYGNAFVSACVIDHLFHMAPGGLYSRQAGSPEYPYAYELLPSIVDHRHFRAAYAGIQIYQGHQYPAEYQGTVFMGNIHDNAVHQDRLIPQGSSFKASFIKDFVRSEDGWFRPVSQQIGPDGALWLMDWYDKFPCYQNAQAEPEGVDRTYGRIWRVVYTGDEKEQPLPPHPAGMDLGKLTSKELVDVLRHPNVWHREMARRLLWEREEESVRTDLEELLANGGTLESRLEGLWTLHGAGLLRESVLDRFAIDEEPAIRTWVARLTGERGRLNERSLDRLERLGEDPEAMVRLGVATACRQFVSRSLTVNTEVPWALSDVGTGRVLDKVVNASAAENDATIEFLAWMAAEPLVAEEPENALNWLAQNGASTMPLSGKLAYKVMRRLCDTREAANITRAVRFLDKTATRSTGLVLSAMQGLLDGQRGKTLLPDQPVSQELARLVRHENAEVVARARELGTLWGDSAAFAELIETVKHRESGIEDRMQAVQVLRQLRNETARNTMLHLIKETEPDPLVVAAIRALGEIGGERVASALVQHWESLSSAAQRAAAEVLSSRLEWSFTLLDAVEKGIIAPSEIPLTVMRTLGQSKNTKLQERAQEVIGFIRPSDADKMDLIQEKRKVVIDGPVDIAAGRQIAEQACLVCHKLHGKGQTVGPDLTGVGRSSLDALLAHIIDPNQIIGKGYENVVVETKDGRSINGRMIEETENRVVLLMIGGREEVIARSDIKTLEISSVSVMPEGLEQMPDQDFRNMIWYLLNPPEDGRPLTPELRRQLIGAEEQQAAIDTFTDGESVSLWNPLWRLNSPEFEGAPQKLPEYAGRNNVLMTHPFDRDRGAMLERIVELPEAGALWLVTRVAAHEKGDWELRVYVNDEMVKRQLIDKEGPRWKEVKVNLRPYAGEKVVLRLENAANDWNYEFGYWGEVGIERRG